jgi:hypothetical protein
LEIKIQIRGHWYDRTALSIKPNKQFKELLRVQLKIDSGYYYCEAQNWSKDKPDAFAGVHSQVGLLLSFDEASGIDDTIYDRSIVPVPIDCHTRPLTKFRHSPRP